MFAKILKQLCHQSFNEQIISAKLLAKNLEILLAINFR